MRNWKMAYEMRWDRYHAVRNDTQRNTHINWNFEIDFAIVINWWSIEAKQTWGLNHKSCWRPKQEKKAKHLFFISFPLFVSIVRWCYDIYFTFIYTPSCWTNRGVTMDVLIFLNFLLPLFYSYCWKEISCLFRSPGPELSLMSQVATETESEAKFGRCCFDRR